MGDKRYWGISGRQSRMARAAIGLSMRDVASAIGMSHQTIKNFENGCKKTSIAVQHALEDLYVSRGCYFGPKDGVSFRGSAFAKLILSGLLQLLKEGGVTPGSEDILNAAFRAESSVSQDGVQ